MGRKGVSKRKPKKTKLQSNANVSDSSNMQKGGQSPVQSLINDKSAPLNRGGTHPIAGSGNKKKKH